MIFFVSLVLMSQPEQEKCCQNLPAVEGVRHFPGLHETQSSSLPGWGGLDHEDQLKATVLRSAGTQEQFWLFLFTLSCIISMNVQQLLSCLQDMLLCTSGYLPCSVALTKRSAISFQISRCLTNVLESAECETGIYTAIKYFTCQW